MLANRDGNDVTVLLNQCEPTLPCSAADLAEPFGLLDLADIGVFVLGFPIGDPSADLNGDGLLDLADINLFVDGFVAGCP